jgi:hypothetical protein
MFEPSEADIEPHAGDVLAVEIAVNDLPVFKRFAILPFQKASSGNPLLCWKEHDASLPIMAKAARRTMCVPTSSAPSERIISLQVRAWALIPSKRLDTRS